MGFPKHVYKVGTGVALNDDGLFTAEAAAVATEEDLAKLEGSWCDSPVAAATKATPKKAEALAELASESAPKEDSREAQKPAKKVK